MEYIVYITKKGVVWVYIKRKHAKQSFAYIQYIDVT